MIIDPKIGKIETLILFLFIIAYYKCYLIIIYNVSESYKRICKKYGIEVHFKGGHTIKDLLMAPKDKDPLLKKSGVIYRYKCDRVNCDEEYIGESARNFEEKFKES